MHTNCINAILLYCFMFWFGALLLTNKALVIKYLQTETEKTDFN